MRDISEPLHLTEEQNLEILRASEARFREEGDPDGNRSARRRAARYARKAQRKQRSAQFAE